MDHPALITALASVQRLEGVAGAMLFKGRNAVHRQMPFSEGRAFDLMDVIGEMLDGYRQVNRRVRQLYLQFDAGSLLVLPQERAALVFFLTNRADTDLVASAGTVFMRDFSVVLAGLPDQPTTSSSSAGSQIEEMVVTTPRMTQQFVQKQEMRMTNWGTLRKQIEAILGKVMGRAQVVMMIDRVIARLGIDDPYRAQPAELRRLAMTLMEQVPNTSKRAALISELEPILQENSL